MNSKIILASVAIAILGVTATAIQNRRTAKVAREAAALSRECDVLRLEIADAAREKPAAVSSDREHPRAPDAGHSTPAQEAIADSSAPLDPLDLERLQLAMLKGKALRTWGPVLYNLGITPDQTEQVTESLINIYRTTERISDEVAQGAKPDDPRIMALKKQMDELGEQWDAALKQLLGPEAYHKFTATRPTAQLWRHTSELAGHLFTIGSPLTGEQGKALVELMRRNAVRPDGRFSAKALDLNATLAQAGAVLEPEQLEVFATMIERRESSREILRLIEEAKR